MHTGISNMYRGIYLIIIGVIIMVKFQFSNGIMCFNKCVFVMSNGEELQCPVDELTTSPVNTTLIKVHHQHCVFVVPSSEWVQLLNS